MNFQKTLQSNSEININNESKKKILVIDDEDVVRNLLKDVLENYNIEVILAENGTEGIKAFSKNKDEIILIILDMVMPDISGEKTFYELRKIKKDLKVLIASGYPISNEVEGLLSNGAKGFIQKPFHIKELVKEVFQLINAQNTFK